MSEKLNIYQKLAKIRKPVEAIQKNKKGFGYMYVTEDVILSKITGYMEKYGVSLIPNIVKNTLSVEPYRYEKTKSTKQGEIYNEVVNEILVHCDMEWHWVNNEDPVDRVVVPWAMVGQQTDASQAFGSGLSYASRYFMLKYFNVATVEDDPDKWRSDKKSAEEAEDREIALGIVEQINTIVQSHLEKTPEDREKIIAMVKKYAKTDSGKPSSNYYDIHNPVVASQLLEEINNTFVINAKKEK